MEPDKPTPRFDEIGPWSEVKLEIIREYAKAYSTILSKQRLHHVYIDAFAGAGIHKRKSTEELVSGSPVNALLVRPPFRHYYFIDLDKDKSGYLRQKVGEREDVTIYTEDCNVILTE